MDKEQMRAQVKAKGDNWWAHYHHYSEALFIKSTAWLEGKSGFAIDAGCCRGDNAFAMAKSFGDRGVVWTFEPDPRLWTQAWQRIVDDKEIGPRVRLFNCALGAKSEVTEFNIAHERPGQSGLQVKRDYGTPITITKTDVVVKRVDDLIAQQGFKPKDLALIKFDLEGGELNAFKGAAGAMDAGRPLCMFECGALESYNLTNADIKKFFDEMNYTAIDCFGLEFKTVQDFDTKIGWNLFVVPNDVPAAGDFIRKLVAADLPAFLG